MSLRDDRVSIGDMLQFSQEAFDLLGQSSQEELSHDRIRQLALTRLVEIIGEAANRVSGETKQKYHDLPWAQIIGMRNRLIHGYDIVDLSILWNTITDDLPPLIMALKQIVEKW